MNGLRKSKSKRRKAHPQQQPPLAATSDNAKRTKRIKSSNGDALLPSPLNASATSTTATTATTATTTTSTTSTTSPPIDATQWGLDPLYWSYVHLTCYQINHAISTLPDKDHAHVLNNTHPLTKATIVGTVVRVVEQLSFTKYTIDDGTGMVDCIQWITKQQQQNLLLPKLFPHGAVVKIRGKLKRVSPSALTRYVCFSLIEISIQSMLEAESVHDAIYHRLKCIQMHEEFYKEGARSGT